MAQVPAARLSKSPTRKVLIAGHFKPSVRQRLLMIRANHPELTQQALMTKALNLLFKAHKLPLIEDEHCS